MRYRVRHTTTYRYSAAMVDGYTVAHLLPRDHPGQQVLRAGLRVRPEPDELDERVDLFGNRVVQLGVHRPHTELVVESECEVTIIAPVLPDTAPPWSDVVRLVHELRGDEALDVTPFVPASPFVDHARVRDRIADLTTEAFTPGASIVDAVRALCHAIHTRFEFDASFSDVSTPIEHVIDHRRGVCQDFAHLAVACLRSVGLPARYVSGYIETEPPPGQPKLVGADASHAWSSTWVPGWGWLDLDPTNDHVPAYRHVSVGWGRDYGDVTPVRGVVIGPAADQELEVAVDVTRVE
jgi:transglutaminase-like putative cysteine protease